MSGPAIPLSEPSPTTSLDAYIDETVEMIEQLPVEMQLQLREREAAIREEIRLNPAMALYYDFLFRTVELEPAEADEVFAALKERHLEQVEARAREQFKLVLEEVRTRRKGDE